MKKPDFKEDGWEQVDMYQYVKQINEHTFIVYDQNFYGENEEYSNIFYSHIDINEYFEDGKPIKELQDMLTAYYRSIDDIKKVYPIGWRQIIAEIIAESSDHDYTESDFE